MAHTHFDPQNKNNLTHRAWESIREFFGADEEIHPLSPDTIAEESADAPYSGANPPEFSDPNSERLHRQTERKRLNDSPATVWPG